MDHDASPPTSSNLCRLRREPPERWHRPPSGSQTIELMLVESDTARYQRFSGAAKPPRRRLAARLALEPDGWLSAMQIAARKHEEPGAMRAMKGYRARSDYRGCSRGSGSHT